MSIYQEYRQLVETLLAEEMKKLHSEDALEEMERQISRMPHGAVPLLDQGEVVELILSVTDFVVFKEIMLDHKTSRTGQYEQFNPLQIKSLGR